LQRNNIQEQEKNKKSTASKKGRAAASDDLTFLDLNILKVLVIYLHGINNVRISPYAIRALVVVVVVVAVCVLAVAISRDN
jgi:hypothetical protein